jgi:hypothetical protein
MAKSAAVSFVAILVVIFLPLVLDAGSSSSLTEHAIIQTGTAIDTAAPLPSADQCDSYVKAAVEEQWRAAAAEVLSSLTKCPAFTSRDRKILAEKEKDQTMSRRFLLRLAVLTQLAGK